MDENPDQYNFEFSLSGYEKFTLEYKDINTSWTLGHVPVKNENQFYTIQTSNTSGLEYTLIIDDYAKPIYLPANNTTYYVVPNGTTANKITWGTDYVSYSLGEYAFGPSHHTFEEDLPLAWLDTQE